MINGPPPVIAMGCVQPLFTVMLLIATQRLRFRVPFTTSLPKTNGCQVSTDGVPLTQLAGVVTSWSVAPPIQSWSAACTLGLSRLKKANTVAAPLMAAE